jgi:copper chaperone CopZ
MTIESRIGEIAGVSSAKVDVKSKKATIDFDPPATPAEIEAKLAVVGYPPES